MNEIWTTRHGDGGHAGNRRSIWRSLLYVPANVSKFIESATKVDADAIVLDLDDTVPSTEKGRAREHLPIAISRLRAGRADVLVRINRCLRLALLDIEVAVSAGCDGLLLPKIMGPEHVALLSEAVTEVEQQTPRDRQVIFVPMIESVAAAGRMLDIALASNRNVGLIVGAEDLATECMISADDELITTIRRQMILAAVTAGIAPLGLLGRSIADFHDLDAVRAAAIRSYHSGLTGATCIHPSIVPILNEAFTPDAKEVAVARRQILAAKEAAGNGRGSLVVDDRMVDEPIVRRAQLLVAAADRIAMRDQ